MMMIGNWNESNIVNGKCLWIVCVDLTHCAWTTSVVSRDLLATTTLDVFCVYICMCNRGRQETYKILIEINIDMRFFILTTSLQYDAYSYELKFVYISVMKQMRRLKRVPQSIIIIAVIKATNNICDLIAIQI
eukprot:43147_1